LVSFVTLETEFALKPYERVVAILFSPRPRRYDEVIRLDGELLAASRVQFTASKLAG
jgi:hypothetical protein